MKLFLLFLFGCAHFLSAVTLEEKIGRLLIVSYQGEDCNADARRLMDEAHVGGFIFYRSVNPLDEKALVKALTRALQDYSAHPLILCVDQEGGDVAHLRGDFFHPPSAYEMAQCDAESFGANHERMASEFKEVGLTLNLSPVVDVKKIADNPAIKRRSLGSDPQFVTSRADQILDIYAKVGVGTCLKHFPGIGSLSQDPHYDLPLLSLEREQLEAVDLVPFAQLAKKAPAIMTTHILVPTLDPTEPITFSKAALNMLRDELAYEGVIMTDSLTMRGARLHCGSYEECAIRALEAGHDILLVGLDYLDNQNLTETLLSIHKALVTAVNEGRICPSQIDASYERVLELSNSLREPAIEDL